MFSMQYDARDYVCDTSKMIKHLMELKNEVATVTSRLESLESQNQVLIKGQQHMIRTLNKMARSYKAGTAAKSQKNKRKLQRFNKETNATDVSKLLHLPKALQKNISKFIEQLSVSSIEDALVEADCLSSNDCEAIRSMPTEQDGARMLLRKIMSRGPNIINKFLEIVGKVNDWLPEIVDSTLKKLIEEHNNEPICVICAMRATVDLKDIGDYLLEEGMISEDIHGDIYDNDSFYSHRQIHWDHIINAIHDYEDSNAAFDVLKKALDRRYEYIVKYLDPTPEKSPLSCRCCKRRRIRKRMHSISLGSQTDLSTTSSMWHKLPTVLNDSNDASSPDVYSSIELPSDSLSFDPLDTYENIESNEVQDPKVSSSTEPDADGKKRHTSGNFQPSSHYEENREDNVLSLPSAGHPYLEIAKLITSDHGQHDVKRSISVQSSDTIRAQTSASSDEASSSISSRQCNKQFSSDMSLTPSPKSIMPPQFAAHVATSVDAGEESDNEMGEEGKIGTHFKRKRQKVLKKRREYYRQSKSEIGLRHKSSQKARKCFSKSFYYSKPRSVSYIYLAINTFRRQTSRREKRRFNIIRQRHGSQNVIADHTSRNDVKSSKKCRPRRRNRLSRNTVLRWNVLQAKYHDRIAQLNSEMQVEDNL
ncbi:hypothetical protein ACF0H5_018136 [Mactra antiquata]